MKKIPSIFERDWNGNKDLVLPIPNPHAQWVFDGEGVAYRKIDGTCCLIQNGLLYKRREIKKGKATPIDFIPCEEDPITNKTMGWVPVGDGPEDKWHREAFNRLHDKSDGTYELLGPSIQGNPEDINFHLLTNHEDSSLKLFPPPPRDFDGLKSWLNGRNVEGIVWHHDDGRMAKIKTRDFGLKRT